MKLERYIFENIKRNWIGWAKSYNPGPFKERYYYKLDTSRPLTRGILRSLLLKKTGIEHKGKVPLCSPKEKPCLICNLLGCLGYKSRIILRSFPKSIFLICENLKEEEKELLEKTLKEESYKFSLEGKEVLKDYLKNKK